MAYDEAIDVLLGEEIKVKEEDGKHAWKLALRSYNGNEPRLEVGHYFLGDDNKWHLDLKRKFPRMPMRLVTLLIQHHGALDKAYGQWKPSGRGASSKPKKGEGEEF